MCCHAVTRTFFSADGRYLETLCLVCDEIIEREDVEAIKAELPCLVCSDLCQWNLPVCSPECHVVFKKRMEARL